MKFASATKAGSGCSRSVSSESSAGKRESCGRSKSGRDASADLYLPPGDLAALLTSSHSASFGNTFCSVSRESAAVLETSIRAHCVRKRFRYSDVTGRKVRERHRSFNEKWKGPPRHYSYPAKWPTRVRYMLMLIVIGM